MHSGLKNWDIKGAIVFPTAAVSDLMVLFAKKYSACKDFFAEQIIYGSAATGIAQFPGLLAEYIANLIIFSALFQPVRKFCRNI